MKRKNFNGDNNVKSSTFYVRDEVASYEIVEYDLYTDKFIGLKISFLLLCGIVFWFAFESLFLSYKRYVYNHNEIVVYADFYHHYIKVNGNLIYEHNTIISFTPICMYGIMEDGIKLNVVISLMNRISLKINDKLYKNVSK